MNITFQPESTDGSGGAGKFNAADKSFLVKMADGKGIAPGKYKVSVQITPYPGPGSQERRTALEPFNNAYATGAKLSYVVTDEATQDVVIDLDKGTVTKK